MTEKEEKCRCGLAVWKHEIDYDNAIHFIDKRDHRLESKIKEKILEMLPLIAQKTFEDVKDACFHILVRTEKEEGVDLPANRFLELSFKCEKEAKEKLPDHIKKWVIF